MALAKLRSAARAFRVEGVWIYERLLVKVASTQVTAPGQLTATVSWDWSARLHQLLAVSYPCRKCTWFQEEAWPSITDRLPPISRMTDYTHDGDLNLALAAWGVTVHKTPDVVIETGVARGMTSAAVLLAMKENQHGHLYSIDLPPLSAGWLEQSAAAVSPDLRARWTYVRGSTGRKLPELLRRVKQMELFIHDSLHTYDNMRFEFRQAWHALGPGGVLLADDIQENRAFDELVGNQGGGSAVHPSWLVGPEATKPGSFWGLLAK
jgi:hypothetical protein